MKLLTLIMFLFSLFFVYLYLNLDTEIESTCILIIILILFIIGLTILFYFWYSVFEGVCYITQYKIDSFYTFCLALYLLLKFQFSFFIELELIILDFLTMFYTNIDGYWFITYDIDLDTSEIINALPLFSLSKETSENLKSFRVDIKEDLFSKSQVSQRDPPPGSPSRT